MPQTEDGCQPDLRHRVAAAAGASVVSALLVNPLDVVKTRVQSASLVTERSMPTCLLARTPRRFPVRWARVSPLSERQSVKLPSTSITTCLGPSGGSLAPAPHLPRRLLLGQLPMSSSCACALKVADLGPERLGAPAQCHNARLYRPVSALSVLQDIVRKEGLAALWRGTDTAMLVSIPMVGVYMPLYDYLLQRTTAPLGGYAPLVAGAASRTLAVLLVGPLELVRTRQQGSVGGARTAWAALQETLRDTAAPAIRGPSAVAAGQGAAAAALSSSVSGTMLMGARAVEVLRSAPRLWTGVVATLARDVPFSALYWALVEPLRHQLLARWQHDQEQEHHHHNHEHPNQQEHRHQGTSSRAILAANLVAGSAAGAVAALVTTPFDVVKTQLQVGSSSSRSHGIDGSSSGTNSSSGRISGSEVTRRILREEGIWGLFRGWAPRACRTAPACAVVVASYEVLKTIL